MHSDWLKFQTFSSQKLLVKFDCDIVGMFIRWFSTNFKFLTGNRKISKKNSSELKT